MKTGFLRAATVILMVALTGCARQQPMQTPVQPTPAPAAAAPATPEQASGEETPQKESEEAIMQIQIGETSFTAVPADTEAAEALMELLADGPVTIQAENYGGFEKVGSLPQALPQADSRITTAGGCDAVPGGFHRFFLWRQHLGLHPSGHHSGCLRRGTAAGFRRQ